MLCALLMQHRPESIRAGEPAIFEMLRESIVDNVNVIIDYVKEMGPVDNAVYQLVGVSESLCLAT